MGAVLREARLRAGVSLTLMAERTHFSRSTLGHMETGVRRVQPEVVRAYERALGVTGLDEDVNRRELLMAAAGLAATEPLLRLVDGLSAPAAPATPRVGMAEVDAVREAGRFATSMDFRLGGEVAARVGVESLRWAVSLMDGSMSVGTRTALSGAVASLADRVAYSLHDSERRTQAYRAAALAVRAAREGGDPSLRAHVLIDIASFTAKTSPGDGVSILRAALSDKDIYPLERANMHYASARMLANDGRPGEAMGCFETGEKLASRAPHAEPPPSVGFLRTSGHLDSVAGGVLMRIAQTMNRRRAVPVFEEAAARLTSAFDTFGQDRNRAKAHLLVKLARVRIGQGEFGEAASLVDQAESRATEVRSGRLRTFVAELRDELAQVT
ncbi:helix-turn-helix domain-containing protein [Amycolatopsis sp. NPDC059027]|uniref:helix-turn-helix domain-containing protein n=1 Tax=Amycolatopsis sp. NPDC059027 TaxID=3346709 RepID=UPI00366ACADA